jgi:DNA-directed RNA polymerase specialized sigma24 family protein
VTADSKIDQPAIEQLIAAFYETGRQGDALVDALLFAIKTAVRKSTSTFREDIQVQVEDEALGHIWLKLSEKKFSIEQRFQPWCNSVVRNLAIDVKRRAKRLLTESDIQTDPDTEGPGVVEVASGRPGEDAAKVIDDAAARHEIARDFEQSLPAAIDRIIFATRFDYLDSVSDDALRGWCRAAKKADLSGELREIHKAPRKRRYQMLAELLQLKDATVRQRAFRAKRLLQARFPDCGANK